MANRHRRYDLNLEYIFDHLLSTKLEQVYDILVPDRVRRIGESLTERRKMHEDSSDLCPRFFGSAERREDDREPNGSVGNVCKKRRLHRTG